MNESATNRWRIFLFQKCSQNMQTVFTMWSVILDSAELFWGETGNFGGNSPTKGAWIKP